MRFRWRTCLNCRVRPVAGCLCADCVRAALVPLVLGGAIQLLFSLARHG